jgi:hypothetical protein
VRIVDSRGKWQRRQPPQQRAAHAGGNHLAQRLNTRAVYLPPDDVRLLTADYLLKRARRR